MDASTMLVAAPATDNLQGKGFADDTRQLSWQLQVQSQKYPRVRSTVSFRNVLLFKASNSLHEPRTGKFIF